MRTVVVFLAYAAWVLGWPFRVLAGAYMQLTYRHRSVPDLFEEIVYTSRGEKVRLLVVAREGVRLGWLVPRGRKPYLEAEMPPGARWLPMVYAADGTRQRLTAATWRWVALRRVEKFHRSKERSMK